MAMNFTLWNEPADTLVEEIRNKLRQYNSLHVGLTDEPRFAITVSGENGGTIGGIVCTVTGIWLEVEYLWVQKEHRSTGTGTELVARAEERGIELGCRKSFLNTFDFQARPFYEKCGYSVVYVQKHYPELGDRYFMEKSLQGL